MLKTTTAIQGGSGMRSCERSIYSFFPFLIPYYSYNINLIRSLFVSLPSTTYVHTSTLHDIDIIILCSTYILCTLYIRTYVRSYVLRAASRRVRTSHNALGSFRESVFEFVIVIVMVRYICTYVHCTLYVPTTVHVQFTKVELFLLDVRSVPTSNACTLYAVRTDTVLSFTYFVLRCR